MSKLSLEAFSQKADQIATVDLLNSINGGTENDCHPNDDRSVGQVMSDAEMQEAEDNHDFWTRVGDWLGL